ncbi:MAG: diphosphate--fructose-6-phosphate 1-phosphotransferase [Gemmatimonadota bacterium]
MAKVPRRMGILASGGPAPGINSVISSAALKALDEGLEVVGIFDGFEHLMAGEDVTRVLKVADVSRIHTLGGSILRTSRANPTQSDEDLQRTIRTLRELGIEMLMTIGGDGTTYVASRVAEAANGSIRVAHVPKTIDNDIPLPRDRPTFGFETARHVGTGIVLNLIEDARTTGRWYFVVVMGRTAGHLALGIGKACGATLTLIPEEFACRPTSLKTISRVLEGAILKRRALGASHGVAVIAEGISGLLDPEELTSVPGVQVKRDSHGHLRLSEIPLETILKHRVQAALAERGDRVTIVDIPLGYELRSAPPIPFDIDYTRTLGYGAVEVLLRTPATPEEAQGGLVCLGPAGRLSVIPFSRLRDPETGRTRVRLVDTSAESYLVARQYMIRLDLQDLSDSGSLAAIAAVSNLTPAQFEKRFRSTVVQC